MIENFYPNPIVVQRLQAGPVWRQLSCPVRRQLSWPVLVEKSVSFLSSVFFDNYLLLFQ
jgi:hypothetical protein